MAGHDHCLYDFYEIGNIFILKLSQIELEADHER